MRALVFLSLCACVGCAGSVSGQIDDEDVPTLWSGFFIQQDEVDDVFGVSAVLVSLFDGCNGATERQKNFNDAFEKQQDDLKDNPDDAEKINDDFADAIVKYDEEHLPTDYWTITVNVTQKDDGDIEDKYDAEDDADKATLLVCRTNDHPRNKDGAVREDKDCFVATKGDIEITAYEKDTSLSFTADVKLRDAFNLDKQKGNVTITGNTSYCEDLEKEVDDFNDLLADAQGGQ